MNGCVLFKHTNLQFDFGEPGYPGAKGNKVTTNLIIS